jgi:hypothetical protein
MISAYEHGWNAAKHAKHIQACPFDTGTTEWREWRAGFHGLSQTSSNSFYKLVWLRKGLPDLRETLMATNLTVVDRGEVTPCILSLSSYTS